MTTTEVDSWLAGLDEDQRATLERLRRDILAVVPGAAQVISYGTPAFKVRGKTVAGFAAFKAHLGYLPHSGTVTARLADELAGRSVTKGSVRFTVDDPLPAELVATLVRTRLEELGLADEGAAG